MFYQMHWKRALQRLGLVDPYVRGGRPDLGLKLLMEPMPKTLDVSRALCDVGKGWVEILVVGVADLTLGQTQGQSFWTPYPSGVFNVFRSW